MNILMTVESFYPHIGGLESITESLANEFFSMGHSVVVITNTTEKGEKDFPYTVLRKPSLLKIWETYNWCDVFVHQQISLKMIWPLFLKRKPWYVVFHQVHWQNGIKGRIKFLVTKFSRNISVSRTTANGYGLKKSCIIYNAYNNDDFQRTNYEVRKDIAFVGRLTKEKGVYLLIDAFNQFKSRTDSNYILKIIGDSQERADIERYALQSQYANDIHFFGSKTPKEISAILNETDILAVTSTHPYYEAFGIVALEGLACGCSVIGADGDGIEEALHTCGILYKNGDVNDLCKALIIASNLTEKDKMEQYQKSVEWLKTRTKHNVASEYLRVFTMQE